MASVLVPLANGCEELEAITVIDLLRRAGVNVISAGLDDQPITASRGVRLIPDTTLEQVKDQDFDMLVLPGGLPGADHLNDDQRIHQLLDRLNNQQKYIAAICAAPKVLATAGLLENKSVTSYPGVLDSVENLNYTGEAVTRDGNIITSRGPGTAMDFALSLIEILLGSDQRQSVEAGLVRTN